MGRDEVRSKKLNSRYQAREPFKIRSGGSVSDFLNLSPLSTVSRSALFLNGSEPDDWYLIKHSASLRGVFDPPPL